MNGAQQILQAKFTDYKRKNPRFTLRAYALRLGVSSGALSEILSGRRRLTIKTAGKFAERLALSPSERARFIDEGPSKPEYAQITQDQFHLISDWWNFAILNLIETRDFRNDPAWIATRLAITRQQVEVALERLLRLEMIEPTSDQGLKRTRSQYTTNDEIKDLSVRRAHLEDLELIQRSLDRDDPEIRDMTSMTLPLNPASLVAAKAAIRLFQDQFVARFGGPDAGEVYRMSLQLYPLSKR